MVFKEQKAQPEVIIMSAVTKKLAISYKLFCSYIVQ